MVIDLLLEIVTSPRQVRVVPLLRVSVPLELMTIAGAPPPGTDWPIVRLSVRVTL
jgi:hypothetical protein